MLITLDSLKDYLQITGNTQDSLLYSAIEQASSFINKYCNRVFEATDYIKRFDGHGESEFILPHFPVNTLTSLSYNTGTLSNPTWTPYDTDSYIVDNDTGVVSLTFGLHKGVKNIQAVYNAGYNEIPGDIQRACILLATDIFSGSGKIMQGIVRERVDGAEVEYDNTKISTDIYTILNRYKRYV